MSHFALLSAELCLRQSKSDSLLAMLSTSSLHSYSDQGQDFWRAGVEDLTRQQGPLRQGAGAVTLESIKINYNTCFTCGVNWSEEHISLDCAECGGYAMQRPCQLCNGSCGQVWSRDLAAVSTTTNARRLAVCIDRSVPAPVVNTARGRLSRIQIGVLDWSIKLKLALY